MTGEQTATKYAVSAAQPPAVWMSEWVVIGGDRVAGVDVPAGYTECDRVTYEQARAAQAAASQASNESAQYEYRLGLSRKRAELVAAGLSVTIARILVPDPLNDYSIDTR